MYAGTKEAISDFPPLNRPRFTKCVVLVEGSFKTNVETSLWPSGVTFGTPYLGLYEPRYGDHLNESTSKCR